MEVEDKDKLIALADNDLALVVLLADAQVWGADEAKPVVQLMHGLVPLVELVVQQVRPVHQAPLAPAVLVAPVVAVSREVDPLGVAKLVAHEVQPAVPAERHRQQPCHLVEGDASSDDRRLLLQGAHVVIHLGVHQAEGDGLVAHESLVVALAVRHHLLREPPVAQRGHQVLHAPVLVP
eukprot:scaffold181505_cov33-Prasinocladus_malaysianus.AAC.1